MRGAARPAFQPKRWEAKQGEEEEGETERPQRNARRPLRKEFAKDDRRDRRGPRPVTVCILTTVWCLEPTSTV